MNLNSCKPQLFLSLFLQLVQRAAVFQTPFECCHVKKKKEISFTPLNASGLQKNKNICTVKQDYHRALLQAE